MTRIFGVVALALIMLSVNACTGTNTEIRYERPIAPQASALRGETVAVLPFLGPNGPNAQDAVMRTLVEGMGAKLISLLASWTVGSEHPATGPTAYDLSRACPTGKRA